LSQFEISAREDEKIWFKDESFKMCIWCVVWQVFMIHCS
jgi:hypothetical protein